MDISTLTPLTEVRLLTGVPLDNKYEHTLTFGNTSSQYAYFSGKTKTGCAFTNLKPSKIINKFHLPVNAYGIYDCNYVMFKNENFNTKWLYAFITDIEFISVDVCTVTFELDVLQTWYFDYAVKESFVIREHVNNDAIGANLIEEGLEIGEYISMGKSGTNILHDVKIVMALSPPSGTTEGTILAQGQVYNGIYSGLEYITYPQYGSSLINEDIMTLCGAGHGDRIIVIFLCPSTLIVDPNSTVEQTPSTTITPISRPTTLDGYTPKNNKLFCYPYSYLYVSNNQGNSAVYKYEYMGNKDTPTFTITGDFSPSSLVYLFPINYKGIVENWEEKLTLGNFPICSWNNDVFANWLAQTRNERNLSLLSNVVKAGSGIASGNYVSSADGVMGVMNQMARTSDMSVQPQQARGNVHGGNGNFAIGIQDFTFIPMTIKAEYAKKADDFLSVFGYKVNAVKVPNINTRESWNYVKTMNVNIIGSIPFNDISKVKSIYDNGITFWHGDYVGDYSRDNSIV